MRGSNILKRLGQVGPGGCFFDFIGCLCQIQTIDISSGIGEVKGEFHLQVKER